ncbi:MAG: LysR family transcriptional regulator [Hyphomicrobiales bacterium]|nr:LysR family transcriptional regulator [Hyphomicrobiales bacterium]
MNFRQLKYFATVVEAKSFTKAADRLHIAQPAISQQIQKLEAEVGESLLLRDSRGIKPTEAGTRLLLHAAIIIQQMEIAKQDLHELHGETAGNVRLGMPLSVIDMVGVELFKDCLRIVPKVKISIVQRLSESLNEALANGDLDLSLTYVLGDPKSIACELLLAERLCLIGPKTASVLDHGRGVVELAEVARLPLVLPSAPHIIRNLIETAAAERGLSLNIAYEVDAPVMIRHMVERGLAYTLSSSLLKPAVDAGTVTAWRIVEPAIVRRLYLARSSKRPMSRSQLAVRDLVHNRIRGFASREMGAWQVELSTDSSRKNAICDRSLAPS